jgi:hypothetical protein
MDYKQKIVLIAMILVAIIMVLGCADTQSFQLSGTIVPNDASVTVNYAGTGHIVTPDAATGHWLIIIPSGTVYTVTYGKTGYDSVTTTEATMNAALDLGTVTLSIQSTKQ